MPFIFYRSVSRVTAIIKEQILFKQNFFQIDLNKINIRIELILKFYFNKICSLVIAVTRETGLGNNQRFNS